MSKYEHTTLEQLRQEVANSLGDSGMVFWPSAEIDSYIEEALLTFGSLSGFWKEKFFITAVDNKQVYDIFTDVTDTTKLAPSLTYQKIIDWLSRDVTENIPSTLLTLQDIIDLIESRYNKFQLLTGLVLAQSEIDIQAQINLYSLDDDIIDIIRLKFIDSENNSIFLRREDEVSLSYFSEPSLLLEGLPEYYDTVYGSPNEIKLYPIPNNSGKIYLIGVFGQETTPAIDADSAINLPNNLLPYLKFGVEADIFGKDGLLNDPVRAKYCEQRWAEGIFIARNYSSILSTRVNGIPITTDSLFSQDLYNEAIRTRNPPSLLGLAGFNILQLDTIPADDQHSIEFVSQYNAPIPTLNHEFIDIELGYVDILLGYVLHLAQMKTGADGLQKSMDSKDMLIQTGLSHNERLQLKGITFEEIVGRTKLEERDRPKISVMQDA